MNRYGKTSRVQEDRRLITNLHLQPSETPSLTDTPSGGGFNDPNFSLAWVGKLDGELSSAIFRLPNFTGNIVPLPSTLLDEEVVSRTIQYRYDGLYRLASAEYDDGNFFNYTYDSVGNRLSETTAFTNTIYAYDSANRMTSVNGVPYAWDANGNLVSDGVNTYAYNHANQLVGLSDGDNSYAFAYNGLGDRLQQSANGVTTNYTLDLSAGLTQVLADGANAYLYGLGRIGEQATEWAYHLPDALGSVRQLADSAGVVSYAQSFEPYGEAQGAFGASGSSYGFAGEWTDTTGLQYLRARYYAPEVGRFISKDPWLGDVAKPVTLSRWVYANANPIYFIDQSGLGSSPIHMMIQAHFQATYGEGHLVIPEFLVVGGSKTHLELLGSTPATARLSGIPTGHDGFIDIVDVTTGEAFEIKQEKEFLNGVAEINWYVSTYNENPSYPGLAKLWLGINYKRFGWEIIGSHPFDPNIAILAQLRMDGVIVFKQESRRKIPVVVPRYVFEWDPSTNSVRRQEARSSPSWMSPAPAYSDLIAACTVVIFTGVTIAILIDPVPDEPVIPVIWALVP